MPRPRVKPEVAVQGPDMRIEINYLRYAVKVLAEYIVERDQLRKTADVGALVMELVKL